jgi:hypothetical protein
MKHFHIHIGVIDLKQSIHFYSTLFGQGPAKIKDDYAKWMLENPKLKDLKKQKLVYSMKEKQPVVMQNRTRRG